VAQATFGLLNLLKILPADPAIRFADRFARFLGPKLWRHKLMMTNLRNAFPEKADAELEDIAVASWGHMGRLAAEYVFLDRLFDFDPEQDKPGRVEVSGIPIFLDLRENPRPFIVFTAHTGNFELLPVAGKAFGLEVMVLFRPPNNPYIAEKVFSFRSARMGQLVPSHPVKTNPLLAKLVRQFDADVYPARCIRLPDNRFRLEIEPRIELPRDAKGNLDVQGTSQVLNDKVESWVREYPEQWLWYHDRWHIKKDVER
jgi:Kdo2-lipid IVA lauroyltransferase/acyltransferase